MDGGGWMDGWSMVWYGITSMDWYGLVWTGMAALGCGAEDKQRTSRGQQAEDKQRKRGRADAANTGLLSTSSQPVARRPQPLHSSRALPTTYDSVHRPAHVLLLVARAHRMGWEGKGTTWHRSIPPSPALPSPGFFHLNPPLRCSSPGFDSSTLHPSLFTLHSSPFTLRPSSITHQQHTHPALFAATSTTHYTHMIYVHACNAASECPRSVVARAGECRSNNRE